MRIEFLGQRAMFLIPSVKVYGRKHSKSKQSVAHAIHHFLITTFGGYTCASGNIYGYFTSALVEYDELREFRVAFDDDNAHSNVTALQKFLASISDDIGEECIYLECADEVMLVYPNGEIKSVDEHDLGRWWSLKDPSYEISNMGRPAVFLLPSHKLRTRDGEDSVEDDLKKFLIANYDGFTTTTVPYFGFWRSDGKEVTYDECRQYEVAILGRTNVKPLMKKLAEIAKVIDEDCIYFKAGQYACLITPKSS